MSNKQQFSFLIHRNGRILMRFRCDAISEGDARAQAEKLAMKFRNIDQSSSRSATITACGIAMVR
jgi:hypothetical protein